MARPVPAPDVTLAGSVIERVEDLLARAQAAGASDLHLTPTAEGLLVQWRIDGVLQDVTTLPAAIAPNVAARLKVLAGLLTYRTDVPQEGRIQGGAGGPERRVSSFPTLHGERVVVRLFADSGRFRVLDDLGLPAEVRTQLADLLRETSGALLLAGPAGSGKTTTLYACLRALVRHDGAQGRRSLASLEDPIEVAVPGVAQSQVNPAAGFDLATGLRSLLRQDPEVIAVGEIRDRATAEAALGASLTGHLVLSSFHAGSAAGAVGRLLDMGLEPYVLRSGLRAVLCQRLVRRLCDACARATTDPADFLGLSVTQARLPVGCEGCGGSGYRGRLVLAEWLDVGSAAVGRAILERADVPALEAVALSSGLVSRWQRATQAVEAGQTSPIEVRRVLGLRDGPEPGPAVA